MTEHALYDPTGETKPLLRPRCTPPDSLEGKTIALLDIGKTRSDEFLDYVEVQLTQRGFTTQRYAKPTNTKLAQASLIAEIAEQADVVIEALAD